MYRAIDALVSMLFFTIVVVYVANSFVAMQRSVSLNTRVSTLTNIAEAAADYLASRVEPRLSLWLNSSYIENLLNGFLDSIDVEEISVSLHASVTVYWMGVDSLGNWMMEEKGRITTGRVEGTGVSHASATRSIVVEDPGEGELLVILVVTAYSW